jgi:hypothetical protein
MQIIVKEFYHATALLLLLLIDLSAHVACSAGGSIVLAEV